jgi:hypothetical protein
MTERQRAIFEESMEMNLAIASSKLGRFRVNVFRQKGAVAVVVRKIKIEIPTVDELQLPQILKDIVMTKLSNGFTEAEIAQVVDPREVEVLYKASLYDALKEGAAPAVKKVLGAPKITPKARQPMSKDVGDSLNLRKRLKSDKLSNSEKASALGDHLARKFGM